MIYCLQCESPMEKVGHEVSSLPETQRRLNEMENMKVTAEKTADVYWCKTCLKSYTVPSPR